MIARFLQRLTLVAFTAHAVLGCCWHHSHARGEESCQRHGHHAELSSGADCCAHVANPSNGSATMVSATMVSATMVSATTVSATTGSDALSGSATIHECDHRDGQSVALLATTELTSAKLLSVDACPCNHTHDCDEARCSYVPRQANPSDGYLSFPAGELFPRGDDLFALRCTGLACADTDPSLSWKIESSQQRCANLQSWQI